jgi:diguanylate cyclase (GGDEF)-like protein
LVGLTGIGPSVATSIALAPASTAAITPGSGIAALVGTPLPAGAPGTAGGLPGERNGGKGSGASAGGASTQARPVAATVTPRPNVIQSFERFIPPEIWLALASALALAAASGAWALYSGHRARRTAGAFAAMSMAALTDQLTGVLNRRGFTEAVERELARARRYDRPFVLAYVDVRGLKTVNDTEGHLMGDELIKAVAGLMKESARADDVVGRIGGDEFALLLGEQTAESAEPVVRRIRARVDERRSAMEIRVPWELTIGIAAFPDDGTTLEELLGVADRRLYEQRGIALR